MVALTYVVVSGVRFEVLGPVDRRRSLTFTSGGYVICPVCERPVVGDSAVRPALRVSRAFDERAVGLVNRLRSRTRRHLVAHLKRDHFRCTKRGCGWVGISPKGHVRRSPNHDGPVPVAPRPRPRPGPRRIADIL